MAARADEWYDGLPPHWQPRAQRIRALLLEASPIMQKQMHYRIPFFDHRTWLAYLSLQNGRLILAFLQGRALADAEGLLARTSHKLIRQFMVPEPPEPMNEAALRRLITEAVLVNDELDRGKKRPMRS